MAKATPSSSSKGPKKEKEAPVELGFLEEDDAGSAYKLRSAFFPSKFGGLPAWLELKGVPNGPTLRCPSCEKPTRFLLQVYAPMDNPPSAFHRSLYVFVCPSKACCVQRNSNKNLLVFRSQLPQENEFYSSSPPDEKDKGLAEIGPGKFGVKLCKLCGAASTQNCSLCGIVYYCGRDHQTLDWGKGHKEKCKNKEPLTSEPVETFCFKEHALVIDTEVIPKQKEKSKSEKDKMAEFEKLMTEGHAGTLDDTAQTREMLEAASLKSDKAFNKFKKRVEYAPDQVLRYDRKGTPLWVSAEKTIDADKVPPCPYCKGPRVFEFQIMPQLLNYVGDDAVIGDLDWGTLAVYTCENNCEEGSSYKQEFIWQQDFKPDDKDDD